MRKFKAGDIDVTFDASLQEAEATVGESTIQVDLEGNFIDGQVFGNVLEKIEGGIKITRPDGSTLVMHDGGAVTVENLVPKTVGVRDLSEIKAFAMRTEDQTRIYRIDFFSGSYLEVTYLQDGQVMEFTGQNLKQSITKDNEIIVSQGDSVSGQVH